MSDKSAICPICGSTNTGVRFDLPGLTIQACSSCGHNFQYPVPSQKILDDIFAGLYSGDMMLINEYFPEWKKFYAGSDEERAEIHCLKMLRRRISLARQFVGAGRSLDIGCGFGQFLQVGRMAGWDAEGVEPSPPAGDYLKKSLGIKVYEKIPRDLSGYQLITLWDVLEHQPSPRAFLEEIVRTLSPDSVLVITVPNRNCFLTWMAEFIWRISLGKIWGPLGKFYFISHLQYFSRESLRFLLKKAGFQILLETGEDTCLANLDMVVAAKIVLRVIFLFSRLFGSRNRILIYAVRK